MLDEESDTKLAESSIQIRELAAYLMQHYKLEFPEQQWSDEKYNHEDSHENKNRNFDIKH